MDDTPVDETALDGPLAGTVRFLKILVTTLTVTTIGGLIVLIAVIVMRVQQVTPIALPDQIALPAGASASAFTQGTDWYAVVTTDDTILIYDRSTGALRQTVQLD